MYQQFAGIYDGMMSEIPYDTWFETMYQYLKRQGKSGGHLCELGCGTGQMTRRFADAGYEVTGIDLSPDMLAIAAQQEGDEEQKILYLNQDMTDFALHKPADVILCICDSANYLLEEEELAAMFAKVSENLAEDGIFLMDMKTAYCFSEIMGNGIRVEDEEDYTVIWDNEYDEETKVNEYLLTMFVLREDDTYDRYDECHEQRAYEAQMVIDVMDKQGLSVEEHFGEDMMKLPDDKDSRWYFVAKRKGREDER